MALSSAAISLPNEASQADLFRDLQQLVHQAEEELVRTEQSISSVNKTHEKMKQEQKVSAYFKNKLLTLYNSALQDSLCEIEALQKVKDKIEEVKAFRQPGSLGLSPERPKSHGMRKGVLMTNIQRDAATLPVWTGRASEKPPPLCGSIPAHPNHVVENGKMVAARVRGREGENWILAEVRGFCDQTSKYEVYDIDAEPGKERHMLSQKKVVALPIYKADPEKHPSVFFPAKSPVLALYPQTTCFYPAVVHSPPVKGQEDYTVLFEDAAYSEGYSPPLQVSQRYVIVCRADKKKATP